MNVGQAPLSGQAPQMNQVGGGGNGVMGSNGVVGADGMPLQQQMQMQDNNAGGLGNGMDSQFVQMRNAMRERIFEYIGRKQTSADWMKRLPELARRLEEILFRKFPSKNEYYAMMKAPVEPQLQFAIKTLSAQNQLNQQNQQMSRQMASSSGYGTMIPTPGITQGATGNSRMSYGADNMGLSSSGAGMVHQNTNMGNSMPENREEDLSVEAFCGDCVGQQVQGQTTEQDYYLEEYQEENVEEEGFIDDYSN